MHRTTFGMLFATFILGSTGPAAAQRIIAPVGAVVDVGGTANGVGSIEQTFNQQGLLTGDHYTSGVSNFNTYIASNPQHSQVISFEWFSSLNTTSAQVTYDLGSVMGIDRLALWNEESAGIGQLNLLGSTNGLSFASLGSFTPFDTPFGVTYGPQVFSFDPSLLRYVRFEMSGCPQPDPGRGSSCAIGEVAFRTATVVPEPEAWTMLIVGMALVGVGLRRRKRDHLHGRYGERLA